MNFEEFKVRVISTLEGLVNDNETITVTDVTKNNGVKYTGVIVRAADLNISPTVYLENYYKENITCNDIECIANNIINTSRDYRINSNFDISSYEDYEKIRKRLFAKLINSESNKILLEGVPSRGFLDLSIVVYCNVSMAKGIEGTFLITNALLEKWDIDKERMIEDAICNTRVAHNTHIINMYEHLKKSYEFQNDDCEFDIEDIGFDNGMFILSNESFHFGAIGMIYEDILKEFCRKHNSNVLIIPSSIHEVILIPCGEDKYDEINNIISAVNLNELQPEDVLSNHGYFYDRQKGIIQNY